MELTGNMSKVRAGMVRVPVPAVEVRPVEVASLPRKPPPQLRHDPDLDMASPQEAEDCDSVNFIFNGE